MTERVTTKTQLKKAQENNVDTIIVAGKLAEKLYKAKKVSKIGKVALVGLAVSLALTPMTAGLSVAAATPIAAAAGLEVSTVIAVSAIGLTLVLAVCKNYSMRIVAKNGDKIIELELTKK